MNNAPAPSMEGLLTIGQAAKICGVYSTVVACWIFHDRLPCFLMKGSGVCAIQPSDLKRFCESNNIEMKEVE